MTNGRWSNNRRQEFRQTVAGRVSWGARNHQERNVGWLSDESAHGISFVTSRNSEPCRGEQVWLTRSKVTEQYRVARVDEYGENESLIGCSRV